MLLVVQLVPALADFVTLRSATSSWVQVGCWPAVPASPSVMMVIGPSAVTMPWLQIWIVPGVIVFAAFTVTANIIVTDFPAGSVNGPTFGGPPAGCIAA